MQNFTLNNGMRVVANVETEQKEKAAVIAEKEINGVLFTLYAKGGIGIRTGAGKYGYSSLTPSGTKALAKNYTQVFDWLFSVPEFQESLVSKEEKKMQFFQSETAKYLAMGLSEEDAQVLAWSKTQKTFGK